MSKKNTKALKYLLVGLLLPIYMFSNVAAQTLGEPDGEEFDQFLFPHAFNMDDDFPWGNEVTLWPFEGAALERIENPDKSGVNQTDFVLKYEKTSGGQPWAGFFYDIAEPMDMDDVEKSVFRLKVWSPREGMLAMLKLELPGVESPEMNIPIPASEEWVQLEWDLAEAGPAPWERVVLIMNLVGADGNLSPAPGGGYNDTWYLDDFRIEKDEIIDIEPVALAEPDGEEFDQFLFPHAFNMDDDFPWGEEVTLWPFEGAALQRITNPDRSGLNRTNAVLSYEKTSGGQPWAGFFYDLAEPMDMDEVEKSVFRLKVWSPRDGMLAMLKLELPGVESPEMNIPIPASEEWVQLEWDLAEAGPAPWERVVLIMNLVDADGNLSPAPGGGFNDTWYLDDFRIEKIEDTSSELISSEIPQTLQLSQNYPNPFNPSTMIDFALPKAAQVTLEVYNMLGQKVVTLENGYLSAGQHSVSFDASDLSSGIYLYRLQAGSQVLTRSLTLVK